MSHERSVEYYANKYRVFEIYGISRNESRKYTMHHIIFRSDIENYPECFKNFDLDKKSNLYPLRKVVHQKLHNRVDRMENERQGH